MILDGAIGTVIQTYNLDEADYRGKEFASHPQDLRLNNDLLNITQPEIIEDIHRQYLEAGADIIETNTFNSNAISQAEYGLQDHVHDLNVAGAGNARRAAERFMAEHPERRCFVAGSMGPTSRTASVSQDVHNPAARGVTFDQLRDAYYAQARGLVEGGVDLLLVETIFDTLNAKAALFAVEQYFEDSGRRVPVMVSVTIVDQSGRTLSGQTVEAFWNSVSHVEMLSVGHQLRAGREADAALHRRALRDRSGLHQLLSERRPAQRLRRLRRNAGTHGRGPARVCGERLGEHRGKLLRLDSGAHPGDCRGGPRPAAARALAGPSPTRASAGWSRSPSARTPTSSTSASAPTSPARPSSRSSFWPASTRRRWPSRASRWRAARR